MSKRCSLARRPRRAKLQSDELSRSDIDPISAAARQLIPDAEHLQLAQVEPASSSMIKRLLLRGFRVNLLAALENYDLMQMYYCSIRSIHSHAVPCRYFESCSTASNVHLMLAFSLDFEIAEFFTV